MEETRYTKLKDLVGGSFTINSVGLPLYKQWLDGEKRFVTSVTPQEGFRKLYPTETDKGKLDLGTGQLGSLLVACMEDGKADLINKTFKVSSNGKSGMDIRYMFQVVDKSEPAGEPPLSEPPTESIPF